MADTLCFSSSSFSFNTNLQLLTCILLHDLYPICSIITSYPLYFSYFIFFSRYFIKLISFISPLFIAAVALSLLLTTTTAFCPKLPQLELEILHTVIRELKSNLDEVNGDEKYRNFEEFEIYKIVFDGTLSISICDEFNEEMPVTKKILEHSVVGWRNDVKPSNCSDLDELGIEKLTESSVHGGRRNDVTITDSGTEKIGVEKLLESSVHGSRKIHVTVTDSGTKKLSVEKLPEASYHGGRINDVTITDSDTEKLGVEKSSIHDGRRNDVAISDSGVEKLGVEKLPESSVHGGRRIDGTITDSDTEILGVEKSSIHGCRRNDVIISDTGVENSGVEKLPETSVYGSRTNDVTISDTGTENLSVEKLPETSVNGGRRIHVTVTDSSVNELKNEKGLEKLLEELDRFESFTTATETDADSDQMIGKLRKAGVGPVRRIGSGQAAIDSIVNDKHSQNSVQNSVRSISLRSNSDCSSNLNSNGWMKEEKQWRRTLACKLFEERYNARGGGEEGMDSLWEDYENDPKDRKEVMISNSNGGFESFEDEDEEDDDEEMRSGHLCCLQALKFSTRKMSLGMGKPNLVKITKALKGFGWLHQVKSKHGKRS